jgi:multisubunit Na+/H+ antiporter MnhE subunit
LLGYAALNVVAYFVWNFIRGEWTPPGWITVTLEAVLVGLLWLEHRQAEA